MNPAALLIILPVIAVVAQPTITKQPTNQAVIVGSNVSFSVSVSGNGPLPPSDLGANPAGS